MALAASLVACDRRLVPTLPDAAGRCRVFCVREMQASVSTTDTGTQCSLRFVSSEASQTDADSSGAVVQLSPHQTSRECLSSRGVARRAAGEGERRRRCPHPGGTGCETAPAEGAHQETPARGLLVCVFCQAAFQRRDDLLLHIRAHAGAAPHACRYCSACFPCEEKLARHQRAHTGFPCALCPKSFRDRSHLARHERLHTGSKPFACSVCPKTFARKEHVTVHEQLHSDDTPYVCRFCHKGFKWHSSLLRHERWHTSLRPFACDVCEESFASKSSLESHMSLHSMRYGRTYSRRRPLGPPPTVPADSGTGHILP